MARPAVCVLDNSCTLFLCFPLYFESALPRQLSVFFPSGNPGRGSGWGERRGGRDRGERCREERNERENNGEREQRGEQNTANQQGVAFIPPGLIKNTD